MFYLTTHKRFMYGYKRSDMSLKTFHIMGEETRYPYLNHLYAPSLRQNRTYHGIYCTSCGTLAGMRNSSIGRYDRSIRLPIVGGGSTMKLNKVILVTLAEGLNIDLGIWFNTHFICRCNWWNCCWLRRPPPPSPITVQASGSQKFLPRDSRSESRFLVVVGMSEPEVSGYGHVNSSLSSTPTPPPPTTPTPGSQKSRSTTAGRPMHVLLPCIIIHWNKH